MAIATARERVGVGSALFFALFTGLGPAGLYLGLLGMLAMAVADRQFWRWVVEQPLLWLALAWTGYILLRMQLPNAYPVDPGDASDTRDGLIGIAGFAGLVLAWWLRGRPGLRRWLLILLPAGLVLGVLVRTEPAMWDRLIHGDHRFFGHLNNGAAGLYSGTVLIGVTCFGVPFLRERLASGQRIGGAAVGLALLSICSLFLFLASQSRSSWLAALVLIGLTVLVFVRWSLLARALAAARQRPVAATLLVAISLAAIGASLWFIGHRFADEAGNWIAVFTLDWDALERKSIGIRVALASVGFQHVAEAPWIGLGFGTTPAALDASDNPLLLPGNMHYHNLYLQIAAMTGLIGLGFFLAVAALVARGALKGVRSDRPELRRLGAFVCATGVFFAVASLFQVRYDDPRGLVFVGLLTAFAILCDEGRRDEDSTRHARALG